MRNGCAAPDFDPVHDVSRHRHRNHREPSRSARSTWCGGMQWKSMSLPRLASSSTANAGAMRQKTSSLAHGPTLSVPMSCSRRSDPQWTESSWISSRPAQAARIQRHWRRAFPRAWDSGSASACDASRPSDPTGVLARGKSLAVAFTKLFQGTQLKAAGRHPASSTTIAYAAGVRAGDRVELLGHCPKRGNRRRLPRSLS